MIEASRFFVFTLMMLTVILTAQSFGIFLSAISPSLAIAQMLAPTITVLLMLFGGFYLNMDNIFAGFKWIEIFSFMQYCYTALMINEFEGLEFNCTDEQATFCLETGEAVLNERGMGSRDKWEELGKLLALTVGFRLAGYVCLRFLHVDRLKID